MSAIDCIRTHLEIAEVAHRTKVLMPSIVNFKDALDRLESLRTRVEAMEQALRTCDEALEQATPMYRQIARRDCLDVDEVPGYRGVMEARHAAKEVR